MKGGGDTSIMLIEQYFIQLKDHLNEQKNIQEFKFEKDKIKIFNLHQKYLIIE